MSKAYEFLKKAGTFYLATVESDGQPRVRPFGAVMEYNGKMYFITSNQKAVYAQLKANPKTEICAMFEGEWIRIVGSLVEDPAREVKVAMLEANPSLAKMYSADDGVMAMFYLENGTATVSSFTAAPVTETL